MELLLNSDKIGIMVKGELLAFDNTENLIVNPDCFQYF